MAPSAGLWLCMLGSMTLWMTLQCVAVFVNCELFPVCCFEPSEISLSGTSNSLQQILSASPVDDLLDTGCDLEKHGLCVNTCANWFTPWDAAEVTCSPLKFPKCPNVEITSDIVRCVLACQNIKQNLVAHLLIQSPLPNFSFWRWWQCCSQFHCESVEAEC